VYWAIVLYRFTLETGKFEIVKDSIGSLTTDSRLQALLIAFAFGAFMEGACGFGTPVAVAAAMLTGLGFSPFRGRLFAYWRTPRRFRLAQLGYP
jgi:lactate permease